MQAELHHVPGIKGQCIGYLQLAKGKVTSCSVEKNGQRQLIGKDTLIRVDNERGPFEWKLTFSSRTTLTYTEHGDARSRNALTDTEEDGIT